LSRGSSRASLRLASTAAGDPVAGGAAGADVLPDPRRAGRSGVGAGRRERHAGAGGRDPQAVRPRPAALRAVRRLPHAGGAARFRRERLFAPAGGARHQAAAARDPGAHRHGAADRHPARHPARHHRRRASQPLARYAAAHPLGRRHRRCHFLVRHRAATAVRHAARLAAPARPHEPRASRAADPDREPPCVRLS